jgi:uncharacterized membrane protein HdeD (DUF308 family)
MPPELEQEELGPDRMHDMDLWVIMSGVLTFLAGSILANTFLPLQAIAIACLMLFFGLVYLTHAQAL